MIDEIIHTKVISQKKPKNNRMLIRIFMENNVKETQHTLKHFTLLCKMRDYLRNIKKHEIKPLKLQKLKMQVKHSNHIFLF